MRVEDPVFISEKFGDPNRLIPSWGSPTTRHMLALTLLHMSTIPTDPPPHEQVRATREHTTPFRRSFARRVRATLAISPLPVRDCLFMYGIAGFKLTLSHFQGMWLVKIVLDQQAYIRIQSLTNLGRTSPVPNPSLDLSTSILRFVSVP